MIHTDGRPTVAMRESELRAQKNEVSPLYIAKQYAELEKRQDRLTQRIRAAFREGMRW